MLDNLAAPPFVTVAELLAAEPQPVLVDARAERIYARGHLPGAVNLSAREINPADSGTRRLVAPEVLAAHLAARGIGRNPVVIYGARGGADAAHLWWTLHAYGHEDVYLLDGGIESWLAAGGGLEHIPVARAQGGGAPFAPQLVPDRQITAEELLERLAAGNDSGLLLLDTRNAEEFAGRELASRRGGHLPGAVLFPWDDALAADFTLRPEAELRAALAPALAANEVVTYCQSGVRAAHTYALLRRLGHPRVRLYLASWGEWGNRDDTPIETPVEGDSSHANEADAARPRASEEVSG